MISEYIRNVFTQFPTNHLLSYLDLLVRLPIVNGEAQTHEVRQDGCRSLLGANRRTVRRRRELTWKWQSI